MHNGFAQLADFARKSENYYLDCGFLVHPESFLMGNEASILVRPVLKINDRKCDLSLLKNVKITLNYSR